MKTFSITMISLVAMSGLAFAQAAKGSAAGGATVGAGATVKTGAGTGSAAGGAKAAGGAATGAAGTAAGGAKAAGGAATGAAGTAAKTGTGAAGGVAVTAGAGAKMEMPKPPAEIAATLKVMGTRAGCKGSGLGPDMKTMVDFKGNATSKLALDGWWIQGSMNGTMGTGKTAGKMKMESFMSYDAATSKWRTLGVMNDGTSMTGWAEIKDGKYEGTAEMTGPMGSGQFKEHGDMTDMKAGMKMWGEMSMDKGKTWMKVYEMTCKK